MPTHSIMPVPARAWHRTCNPMVHVKRTGMGAWEPPKAPAPPVLLPTHHTPHAGARRHPADTTIMGVQERGIRHPVNMHNHCISGIWGGTGKWRISKRQ
ncbi:hypothetical protein BTHE_1938 [Bifidobacterium thermophilum]|nr:hypothetical protein BTHE_1938 [Bifidobacterium thermophilum]